ncbi:MAG: hypothetical protein Harvfovirus4_1, partial [Harvfovirus sp.]
MECKQYENPKMISDEIKTIKINEYDLLIVEICGTIYRGDGHVVSMIRDRPTFFGDYESAMKYSSAEMYLKSYKTKNKITLLVLTKTKENILYLHYFFKNYLTGKYSHSKQDLVSLQITYIMLQVAFGLIPGSMKNIDLCSLSIPFIDSYLRHQYDLESNTVDDFILILTKYRTDDVIPFRYSQRSLDRILMENLSKLLKEFGIEGIFYHQPEEILAIQKPKLLCVVMNKILYEKHVDNITCPPSEICVFSPV